MDGIERQNHTVCVTRLWAIILFAAIGLSATARSASAVIVDARPVTFSGQVDLSGINSGHSVFVWADFDLNGRQIDAFVQPLGNLVAGSNPYSFTQSLSPVVDFSMFTIIGETGASDLVLSVRSTVGDNAVTQGLTFAQLFPTAPAEQTLHDQLLNDQFGNANPTNQAALVKMFEDSAQNVPMILSGLQAGLDGQTLQNISAEILHASTAQHAGGITYTILPAPEPAGASLLLLAGGTFGLRRRRPTC